MNEDGYKSRIDLAWSDDHVVPEVVTPEVEFMFRRMIEIVLLEADIKPEEVVLDVGCGRALDSVRMAEWGARVVGIEPSTAMLRHACDHIRRNGASVMLVRGIGEDLPFRSACIDKVICKGAVDHFADPVRVMEEMSRVLKDGGRAVVAVANFGSLGFKLGKAVYCLWKMLGKKEEHDFKMPWEVPADHTYRFDYVFLKQMLSRCFGEYRIRGVSLLFGLPWWGAFLAKCPQKVSQAILAFLDKIACYIPRLSDVLVAVCMPKNQ